MGLDANAIFFYGVKIFDEDVEELKLRDERNGKRYCKTCGSWLDTHFCPKDGTQTEPQISMIGLNEIKHWGVTYETEINRHAPHSTNLALYYLDTQWPGPFYLYIKRTQVNSGDVRGGPSDNEPKEVNLLDYKICERQADNEALQNAFKYIGLTWSAPKFYIALNAGW